ncbi:MAG TPA: efflux RND transporter periplasmic adaptor subunit [Chryseolinea sp.]|nr:efflux RND transporter periplasmic adaptor subunit [Chryseolinea sp.]
MKNIPYMNSTVYTRLSVVAVVALLAACSAATPDDKKAQLEKLKAQQVEITKQVQQLEKEIAKENPTEAKIKTKDVAVAEIKATKFDHYVQTQGRVEAEDNISVSAKSPGVVMAVYVNEGQQVSKGQALAQIDNAVILRNIESMKSQLELAKSVYDRQKNLWDQKIGTEVQFLQAKTNKEGLERQIASLQEQNEMLRIKSPINGTVDEVIAKIGEAVSPGMPAFRVVNTSDLKLTANVSEAFVTDVKKGNKVIVTIPELKKDLESKVTFVGKTIDQLTRTFTVEVALPSEANLRPNMSGVIKVVFHSEPTAITVPINVVQDINGEKIVFVAEADGKNTVARKKVVKVEGVYGGKAQVSGLTAGEKVVTFGYQGLNDGEFLKI